MESEKTVSIAVLDDGDHTTWCSDALVVEIPANVYHEDLAAGDSKLLRNYVEDGVSALESVWTVEKIRQLVAARIRDGSADRNILDIAEILLGLNKE